MHPTTSFVLRPWLAALACTLSSGSIAATPTPGQTMSERLARIAPYFRNSRRGIETCVRMGTRIGVGR